ncbi:DUF2931 family protein [Vibrio fluvialis]|jgi:hypothetical protein|uniref:DUF2931 family protein n=1 Tax=Vibrio fluvialis TaxID=676 RepID=UPI00155920C8|nr:DUF2931 family protein [Vibrio fluvialis]EKO3367640.1 DUF2931 family protein [Vibrio fluvialis]EKO3381587.1 DUF2931 family protein [Vibrio fluvialis]EKO3384720.1 DUF2931 family protein [Vibrio fluvialis]EKO3549445.1 DUF2931 family protein [Vibrio fluvialis]EKO3552059.1 DUF2931 family protein [Vibrio fluvialis]
MKRIFTLMAVFVLYACSLNASSLPDRPWTVSVTTPSAYPVSVTQAYGVNDEEDWTSLLHNFSQFMRISDFKNISPRFEGYDGYGLPIADYAMNQQRQITPIKLPPNELYIYWTSLINTKFFVTKYEIPSNVRELVGRKGQYRNWDGTLEGDCYRTEFVFGLLPDGNAKIYLRGCGEIVFLKDLAANRILDKDANGASAEMYINGSVLGRIHKRAADQGVSLDPIPWDKVNKVYAKEPIISLEEALAR